MTQPDVLKLPEIEVESNHNELIVSPESGEQNFYTETETSVGRQKKNEPTVNSVVDFLVDACVSTEKFTARILSRAGKNGKNKSCYNIQYLSPEWAEGQNVCLDFETDVTSWNQNSTEVFLENETDFETAKQQKLSCWVANDVYDEVDAVDDAILSLRWVPSFKTLDDGSLMPKARLVVKGYLEDLPKFQCESPAVSREALKVFFSICASQNWAPQSLDIKTHFTG